MQQKLIYLLAILLGINTTIAKADVTLPSIPTTQYLITSYGASTDSTNNATYINKAISAASSAGGGTVVCPSGKFYSGPITMKSNVNLYLASGDTLQILPYGNGNGSPTGSYPNNGTSNTYTDFIYGSRLTNIEVSGSGVIEGNGSAWWTAYKANSSIVRPCLIRFKACTTVWITGITLENAPNVHICLGESSTMGSNGTISYVTITAPSTSPNTDAIDTWYWNGISIHHCNLSEGDDNVAMDSYSQNVTIKDCTLGYGHGISVGSYSTAVQNVTVDSCTFTNTTNGIRLKSERGRGGSGSLTDYNLSYSNITMTNVTWPFYITSYYNTSSPSTTDPSVTINNLTPTWRKIYFKNITVTNSANAGFIWGLPEQPVDSIVFDNVQISAATKGMQICHVDTLIFINCSSITLPSSAGSTFSLTSDLSNLSGINASTGASTSCTSTGIQTVTDSQTLQCAPNPTSGYATTITADQTIDRIELYSLSGMKTKDVQPKSNTYVLDTSGLPSGCYILKSQLGNGTESVIKLIVQH